MPIEYVLDHARQRLMILGRDPVAGSDVLVLFGMAHMDAAFSDQAAGPR